MYWDVREIVPNQRMFNFINGPRGIGKTYSVIKYCIQQNLKKGCEFVTVCRTKSEKKMDI